MPTSLPQLVESIVVGQLQTSLENATVFSPGTPMRSALKDLQRLNFDQAPVVEDRTPIGYVLARNVANKRGTPFHTSKFVAVRLLSLRNEVLS